MGQAGKAFVKPAIPVIAATLLTAMKGPAALANEHNCRRLENLARRCWRPADQAPTANQSRLVAWYNGNCRGDAKHRRAANPSGRDL